MTCLVLTPFPPLQMFGQPEKHLVVVGAQLVRKSLGASSFYEILVSLWVWSVALWLPRVYSFVNRPHLSGNQLDPLIGVG